MLSEGAILEAIAADTLVLVRMWAGQPLPSADPLGSVQALEMSCWPRWGQSCVACSA
jgi:hypothetical protein